MKQTIYFSPEIELVEVAVERGFAATGGEEDKTGSFNGEWVPIKPTE